ncbi:MAG: DUF2892 domain-containing protein [Bacteroidota bacterium]
MTKNMAGADRIIRILIAVAVAAMYYFGVISGTLAIVLGVVAGIFLLTGLINFCPLYAALGIRTNKASN